MRAPIISITYAQDDGYYEQTGCGRAPMLPKIHSAVKNYDRWIELAKYEDDGAKEVVAAVKENELDASLFRVGGVNVGACVKETITTLVKSIDTHVELVADACGCDMSSSKEKGLQALACNNSRISIVRYPRTKVSGGISRMPYADQRA